jgi:membrane protein implicated in regulation of membrane protease activity
MDQLIRYCVFLIPEALLLAGGVWLAVSLGWMLPSTAVWILGLFLLIAVLLYPATRRLREPGAPIGAKALVGRESTLVRPAAPVGRVRVDGELWLARARHDGSLPKGTRVRVVDASGLELIVEPLPTNPGD